MNTSLRLALGLACSGLVMVSCTSLPSSISQGIESGNPHAYYEAGKHIDHSKTVKDSPALLQLLCFPVNLGLVPVADILTLGLVGEPVRLESCFYYRSHASKNKEAVKYYSKGAELGDADCLYEMGRNYENGWGVSKNVDRARVYYGLAAEKGSSEAQAKISAQSPASIAGKTIVYDYSRAQGYQKDDGGPWTVDSISGNSHTDTYTSAPNTKRGTCDGVGEGHYLVHTVSGSERQTSSYDYQKTGATTATICMPGYEWETTYTLTFETATTGTMSFSGGGEGFSWKGSGIRFSIK